MRTQTAGEADEKRRVHGMSHTRTYDSWRGMIDRCTNSNSSSYHNYGGRGITVCKKWRKFINFRADMGDRPHGETLDRIDIDGSYEPRNCRWATRQEQSDNLRTTIKLTHQGITKPLGVWARELGIKKPTLYARIAIHNWDAAKALTYPVIRGGNHHHKRQTSRSSQ